ncbi:MAG: hypothetical protein NC416_16245 [Eubacterium sp.]|nr:hypothetical protein [Eubacterium sp.]
MSSIELIKAGEVDEVDLLEYITDNDIEVAIAAAESDLATEPILDIAAHDRDARVRLAAVNNVHIGRNTLMLLKNDIDDEIARIAAKRLEGLG